MVRGSLGVQRLKDFVRRLHFHEVAAAKFRASLARVPPQIAFACAVSGPFTEAEYTDATGIMSSPSRRFLH